MLPAAGKAARVRPFTGILLKVCSVTVFVCMASLIKATSDAIPPGEAVFFRSLFAIPVIILWLAIRGRLGVGLRTRRPMAHVWRGVIGTTAMGLGFAGLGLLPLPAVTAIGYAAPVLVVLLAAIFLGERIRFFRMAAVVLGLLGVLVVIYPNLIATGQELRGGREALGAMAVTCELSLPASLDDDDALLLLSASAAVLVSRAMDRSTPSTK